MLTHSSPFCSFMFLSRLGELVNAVKIIRMNKKKKLTNLSFMMFVYIIKGQVLFVHFTSAY